VLSYTYLCISCQLKRDEIVVSVLIRCKIHRERFAIMGLYAEYLKLCGIFSYTRLRWDATNSESWSL